MARVAGVDSSTQSVKIVVRDSDSGELLAQSSRPHPNGTEVDPAAWWEALCAVIEDVGGLQSLDAISIAGQQHGMVVLDENGDVIRKALLWNDTRSAPQAEALNKAFPEIHQLTGSTLVASFTATKVRWLYENEPENAARVRAIALPHDWLSWKLSGSAQLEDLFTDRSDTSGTGYFNPVTNTYTMEIVKWALGHTNVVLPRIVAPHEVGARNGKCAIACGAGDNAGAALGVGATVGDLVISLGTSGTAFVVSSTPTHDSSGEVAGFADAAGNYLPLACTLNAAKIFDSTAKLLNVDYETFGALALSAPSGAQGLMVMPHFDGERTPNRPDARGQFLGITHANFTPENIARASIEGVIASMAYATQALVRQGVSYSRIFLVGGAARNRAVQEIAATIFASTIYLPEPGEYVAEGAARQAAWALTGKPPTWGQSAMAEVAPSSENSPLPLYMEAFAQM